MALLNIVFVPLYEMDSRIFKPTSIGRLALPNAIARSATWLSMVTEGLVNEKFTEEMVRLVAGDVGLVIVDHTYVADRGRASSTQTGIVTSAQEDAMAVLVDRMHAAGESKVCLQIAHAGPHAAPADGVPGPIGPSPSGIVSAFTEEEAEEVVVAFANAAVRSKRAGFDAVQIHAAHSYLLSSTLTPGYNTRTDKYGASTEENRNRLLLEVTAAVREAVGPDFPVLVKINVADYAKDEDFAGITPELCASSLALISHLIDGAEISGGQMLVPAAHATIRPAMDFENVYHLKDFETLVSLLKDLSIDLDLLLVGGIRSKDDVLRVLGAGAKVASIARPFIRQPELVKTWKLNDVDAQCRNCNACLGSAVRGGVSVCPFRQREEKV